MICQIVKDKLFVAVNKYNFIGLDEHMSVGNPKCFVINRHFSQPLVPRCVEILLKDYNLETVYDNCALQCASVNQTAVENIEHQTFSILNPTDSLLVVCNGRAHARLPPISSGRYEVEVPCECNVQSDKDSSTVLIRAHSNCNSKNASTFKVNMHWADANSPL
jgi:hypothetical protein